jgi:hypothetical protein
VNAVLAAQMAQVSGTVVDASNARPLAGVRVRILNSANDVVISEATTDQYGNYIVTNLLAGNYKMLFAADHYSDFSTPQPGAVVSGNSYIVNASLSRQLEVGQFRIVLTWTGPLSGAVQDVDSYLLVPGYESAPIYFSHRNGSGANLDVDDTTWSGPETITITSLYSGTYRYYVANYNVPTDGYALGRSLVNVQVYNGTGLVKQYTINGGCGSVYEFFRIENGVIRDINKYDATLPAEPSTKPVCP